MKNNIKFIGMLTFRGFVGLTLAALCIFVPMGLIQLGIWLVENIPVIGWLYVLLWASFIIGGITYIVEHGPGDY